MYVSRYGQVVVVCLHWRSCWNIKDLYYCYYYYY